MPGMLLLKYIGRPDLLLRGKLWFWGPRLLNPDVAVRSPRPWQAVGKSFPSRYEEVLEIVRRRCQDVVETLPKRLLDFPLTFILRTLARD